MKRRIAAALVVACLLAQAALAADFMSKFRFSIETLPDQDGGGFKGEAGFKFSDRFASMLYVKRLVTAETGKLDLGEGVATDSLNLLRSSVTEYFILPVEYTIRGIGTEGLTFGLGGYVSATAMKNVGYFKLTPSYLASPSLSGVTGIAENNYYDSGSEATFYGPVLTAQAYFDLGFVSLDPRLVVVPLFFFGETSSLEISPLLTAQGWNRGEISYKSKGFPYFAASMEDISFPVGKFLPLSGLSVGGGLSYEMSRQSVQLITQGVEGTNKVWTGTSADVTSTTFSYRANLGYKFPNGSFVRVGIGQRKTKDAQEGGATTSATRPIYSIKYSLQL